MNLEDLKVMIESIEQDLPHHPFSIIHTFVRDNQRLQLGITERLRRQCRRGRVWKSKEFLTALKNAQYGFDETHARSPGGSDGIFLLTPDYRPKNEMMKKLFDRFLHKPDSGAQEIAKALECPLNKLIPVRLVSHHMRLLGVLARDKNIDRLILVDFDNSKST